MIEAMADCWSCGTALVESANFCFHCGAPFLRPKRARPELETKRIIGREEELEAIAAAFGAIRSKKSAAIIFTAESGLGKTALLLEAERLSTSSGLASVFASCAPERSPYDL